ncbi:TonB-dependent siderophore receptor [Acinetobacter sp. B5B]|uniref:TonB-dependent siderophore receptor n=1 Tax=Acinetobacter baretiae TaxID=2605383 RepID=UPI0018C25F2D|nr:TonB-dependent siderophore receptor [Acinetobacter baretiae]MBF7682729.1 TonB-dependent siderophore receptor [Acinetobacter baretiae]
MKYKLSPLTVAIVATMSISSYTYAADYSQTATLTTIKSKADQATTQSSEQTKSYIIHNSSSATGLNLTTKETPQTVNVVTRQQMDDFNLTTTRDILSNTPGVMVTGLETNRTTYTARGFDISNILYDGVGIPQIDSYNYNGSDDDSYFYDRVEVIKGADALTNALGDPGATINYVRKRPTQEFQANAGFSYGSWSTKRYEADLSGPLTQSGNVRGRLTAYEKTGDSYLDKYSEEKNGVQAIIDADLSDRTKASVGFSRTNQLTNGSQWGALPLTNTAGQQLSYSRSYNYAPDWTYFDWTTNTYFANIEQKVAGDWVAKLTYDDKHLTAQDKMLYLLNNPNASDNTSGVYFFPDIYNQKFRKQTLNANVSGTFPLFDQRHEANFGYTWSKSVTNNMAAGALNQLSPTTDLASWSPSEPTWAELSSAGTQQYTLRSMYGATRVHLNDNLKLILGANFSKIDFQDSYVKSKTSPYAGLTYNFTPQYTGYMSYTSIFRPQTVIDKTTNKVAVPVDGKSYEAGLKGAWFNERLTGSIAIFSTQQNHFALNPTFMGSAYYSDLGTVKSQGVELGLTGKVTENIDVSAGYTQFSLKNKDNGINPRQYNPTQSFNILANYTLPQFPQIKVGASVKWQDTIRDPASSSHLGTITQSAYALFDLMASYKVNDHINLQLNAKNIGNEKYLTGLKDGQGYYGAPANYTVSVKFKY